MKYKLPLSFAFLAVFALLTSTATADGLPSPRVFTRGSFVYVVESERIVFLSMDTRGSHALYVAPDPVFSIVSVVQSGGMLWASNGAGAVIGVDMQAGTVEEYGRGRVAAGGRLGVDPRYLWLAADDTLFRMDITSREWVPIPIPDSDTDTARAVVSVNDQIHVVSSSAVYVYRPISGDWVTVPHAAFVLGASDFYMVENICYFTEGKKFYRYDTSKRLWSNIALRDTVRAVNLTPETMLAAVENRVYQYNSRTTFTLEPHPAIPALRGIRSVTRHGGRVVCALDKGLGFYSSPFDFSMVYYPEAFRPGPGVFAFSHYGHIILYGGGGFIIYNPDRGLWSGVPVVIRNREQAGRYAWDENGAHVRLSDEYKSTLGGTATASAAGSVSPTVEQPLSALDPIGTVNLRTEDLEGRTLDVTLDNSPVTAQDKGVYYKGIEGDILNRASYGVQGTGMSTGRLTPDALSKGASVFVGGKAKAGEADRSFVSAAAGSGYLLSKSEWRSFSYNPAGVYTLSVDGDRGIAESSVRMYVDGVALSGADYVYDPASRSVYLRRRDRANPTSSIQVNFALTAFPSVNFFEYEPVDRFERYSFAEGSVSPRSWLSARAGVLSMGGDTAEPVILASTPVEWRGSDANRSFQFVPEVAYNSKMGTHAAGVTLGARENRAFGSYKGYWAARDFSGMERYSFENRGVGEEHDIDFGCDLRDDLRLGWRQLHREMDFGSHTQFEAYSNYAGVLLPDVEMALSSRIVDVADDAAGRRRKETMYLRLSDLASRYLTQMSRIHNVGYDFSLTEYRTDSDENGRVAYGWASVSPTSKLTFTGSGTYRANPSGYETQSEINPTLAVNTRGLPAGVDAVAGYSLYAAEQGASGTVAGASKNVSGYVYPGEYYKPLDMFALYLEYGDSIESRSPAGTPAAKLFFLGDERTYYMWAQEAAGLIFFPTENMLMSSYGARTRETGALTRYRALERVKMWFENGGSAEGNLEIVKNRQLLYTAGNSIYEHVWNENLMTGAGVFGVRYSENFTVELYGGPQFKAAITKELDGIIKAVENSHNVWATINRNSMSKPDIRYETYLRLKMSPNISLVGELQAALLGTRDRSVAGSVYLHAGF